MIAEFLKEQATLYVSGSLPPEKAKRFELLIQCHEELRHFTALLAQTSAPLICPDSPASPSLDLKQRIMASLQDHPQPLEEALVMSDPKAQVQWISPAFTEMCGHTLKELQGNRLGPILQGKKTDPQTSARLRTAIDEQQACREIILNYHKDGHPYWVEIVLTPIKDDEGKLLCFVAQEYERPDIALP